MAADPILVTRSSLPPFQEFVNEIAPLWESHWLTNMGEKHAELEAQLKDRLGVQNARVAVVDKGQIEVDVNAGTKMQMSPRAFFLRVANFARSMMTTRNFKLPMARKSFFRVWSAIRSAFAFAPTPNVRFSRVREH